ncbi:MAG: FHA domain-containing protein, partial [Anaerolineales bacterium]
GSRKDALQVLADGSDGQYALLDRSGSLSAATAVYQAIDTQRTYYTVTYRSPVSEGEQREITINTTGRPSEGVVGTYEIALLPPSVSISEPIANSVIRREATLGEEEGAVPTFDTVRLRVVADVTWPDGRPRSLQSAELTIDGRVEDSIELAPDQTRLEFEWDLSDIVAEGMNSVTLGVSVEDELGMVAATESAVSVEVINIATPEPGGFKITPLIAALSVPLLCFIGLVIAGIGGAAFYLLKVRGGKKGVKAAQDEPEILATVFADDTPELAFATLTLLEGPSGLIGDIFRIASLKTTIGRNPGVTDISFYSDEESSVSRVHCSLTLDDDNVFRLTDMRSSAGTLLNGRRIQPETPVMLDDGDEIVLGNLARRGVKLRFNLATEDDSTPYSGTADDRTHFVGDQEA